MTTQAVHACSKYVPDIETWDDELHNGGAAGDTPRCEKCNLDEAAHQHSIELVVNGNSESVVAEQIAEASGKAIKITTIKGHTAMGDYRPPVMSVPERVEPLQGVAAIDKYFNSAR